MTTSNIQAKNINILLFEQNNDQTNEGIYDFTSNITNDRTEHFEKHKKRCYNCCRIGHYFYNCKYSRVSLMSELPTNTIIICQKCKKIGHISLNCPNTTIEHYENTSMTCNHCISGNHQRCCCPLKDYVVIKVAKNCVPYCLICNNFGHTKEYCEYNDDNLLAIHKQLLYVKFLDRTNITANKIYPLFNIKVNLKNIPMI